MSSVSDSAADTTLHCVVRAPHDGEALALALAVAAPGDSVLVLQDGVHAATSGVVVWPEGVRGYVLMADVIVRGLDPQRVNGFTAIDAAGFVALAAAASRQVCWA